MHKTIKIPNYRHNPGWAFYISANRFQTGIKSVKFDFSNCVFLEPYHLVSLACLIEEYHQNGVNIYFHKGTNSELNEYLTSNRFYEYWTQGFDRTAFNISKRKTSLGLWKFSEDRLSSYADFAKKYFEENYLFSKDVAPLHISLSELFNNIKDHSGSPIGGYTMSQYYPNIHKMKIALCDFGIGIPTKVNNHLVENGDKALLPKEALRLSFKHSFSTKSQPHNRGFGLNTLKTIVENSNGRLNVVSQNASFKVLPDKEQAYTLSKSFNGTQFEIILDTRTFDDKEDDFIDEDFIF